MVKALQAWRNGASVANFMVTKVYNELLTQYAMLHPAKRSAPVAETIPVKISGADQGATLPGFTFTQDEF